MKILHKLAKTIFLLSLPSLFVYAFVKLPKVVSSAGSGVVVNEVAWGGTTASASDEWIELYNGSGVEIDLTDWTLNAADGSPSITLTGTVPAGGYYLLERSDNDVITDITADQVYTGALSNTGETLELRNATSELEDTVNSDGGGWPAGSSSPSNSMERIDPILPGTDDNWATNDGVTINGQDVYSGPILGTPKSQNSVYASTPSPTNTPTETPTPTLDPSPTETPTNTPTPTDEPTETPTPTEEPTPTPTESPTPTPETPGRVFWKLGFGSNAVTCRPVYKTARFGFFRFRIPVVICN
jgi:hypothetical protein